LKSFRGKFTSPGVVDKARGAISDVGLSTLGESSAQASLSADWQLACSPANHIDAQFGEEISGDEIQQAKQRRRRKQRVTTVAKSVGSALGTIAGTATKLLGGKPRTVDESSPKRTPKSTSVTKKRAVASKRTKKAKQKRKSAGVRKQRE
jgi:hypothetical protein